MKHAETNMVLDTQDIRRETIAELMSATAKFPNWPTDPMHALAIIGEEFGELTNATLERVYKHKSDPTTEDIRKEAIQTIAMLFRFVMSLERYDYNQPANHIQ